MTGEMQLKGRAAIITGAASGIGRALAHALARRGCHLALADVNMAGLEETAQRAATGVRITRHSLDVGDAQAIAAFPDLVRAEHGRVDLLVNNAGVALGGTFEQIDEAEFDWLLAINFFGAVRMTRAFLPMLKASDDARIVNISSIFGIIAPPGQTAYCASKFAVRGFCRIFTARAEGHIGRRNRRASGRRCDLDRQERAPFASRVAAGARDRARLDRGKAENAAQPSRRNDRTRNRATQAADCRRQRRQVRVADREDGARAILGLAAAAEMSLFGVAGPELPCEPARQRCERGEKN